MQLPDDRIRRIGVLDMPFPPVCSVRETVAFLRDPAAFSAGPGLRLGGLYRVRIPGYRLFVVTDPGLVEQILVRNADRFEKGGVYWHQLRRAMGESMGSLDGDRWEYLHRIQSPFFSPKAVRRYLPAVEAQASSHFQKLSEGLGAAPEVSLLEAFAELNARIVLSVLFGREDEPASREIAERIADAHEILAWSSKYPWRPAAAALSGASRRMSGHRKFFSEYVGRLPDSPRAGDAELLLHALVRVREDPDAPCFSPTLLRNEVVFHVGAITETQAVAEGWTIFLLSKHPEALERMRHEMGSVAGRLPVGSADVEAMTYTRQVVQEALRLFPPVFGVVRDCTGTVDLGRHQARAGDTYLVSVYGVHRDPASWQDPGEFRPERFGQGRTATIGKYRYLPFGAGRHVCIGQHLALPAMVLAVGQFAQRFDWTFSDPDVRPEARPSLKPSGPFRATLRLRT